VLLFGTAGLFGKLLSLPPLWIVFGRCGFAALALGAVALLRGNLFWRLTWRELFFFLLLGLILALHWITFFQAIQVSSVALGLITYSTFPLFTTILEPLFFKEALRPGDLLGALVMLAGLILVVPDFTWGNHMTQGVVWGTLSGLSFALLSVLNRRGIQRRPALMVTLFQTLVAALVLVPLIAGNPRVPGLDEIALLLVLGVICTALAHFLFVFSMRDVSAQLASMVACLEAVYGAGFAYLLLGEVPDLRTLAGGSVILVTALLAIRFRRCPEF
jgi:drug/metabolite transporter (DMT)-like permease